MKHLFLPLPIDTVRRAWDEWRVANAEGAGGVHLIEVEGGCYLVTEKGRPPKVFVELLKGFMESKRRSLARAG